MNLGDDIKWVKSHVITLVLAAALVYGATYTVLYVQDKARKETADQNAAIVAQIVQSNKELQELTEAQVAALLKANEELRLENEKLVDAVKQRQVIEVNLPKQNATLTATQVAEKLGGTAQDNDVLLPLGRAQDVLTSVQLVPLLQQDKKDLQAANGLLETEVSNAQQALDLERKAHTSDNSANAATIKQRDLEVSACKANARKGKLKAFGIGYVAGFVSAIALRIWGV